MFLCTFIKLVLYSCIDEFGERSLEITHASKKFDLDSHRESSLCSLAFCSSVATKFGFKENVCYYSECWVCFETENVIINLLISALQNIGITIFSKLFLRSSACFRTLRKNEHEKKRKIRS